MSTLKTPVERCIECNGKISPEMQIGHVKTVTICSVGCRRKRRNRQQLAWRKRNTCPSRLHGTISGYGTYGCRCEACREANTLYTREKRKRPVE